ncbi:unnamed protein product, partial [Allacma fusca]
MFLKDDVKTRWQNVIQNKLCIGCFGRGHRVDSCMNKRLCGEQNCEKFHHQLLHKKVKEPETEQTNVLLMNKHLTSQRIVRSDVHLKVLPVVIKGPGGEATVNAIMDDGSTLSLLDMELAQKLGIRGRIVPLCMQWTTGDLAHEDNSEVVSFTIRGAYNGAKLYNMYGVRTTANSNLPGFTLDADELRRKYHHLSDVPFSPVENQRPLILIGHDYIQLSMPRRYRVGKWSDPIASKTLLGWVIHGDIPVTGARVNDHVLFHQCVADDELNAMVKDSFSTESFGVKLYNKPLRSQD